MVSLLPYILSSYFGEIPPLYNPLYLQLNWKDMLTTLSAVYIPTEVMEAFLVAHEV